MSCCGSRYGSGRTNNPLTKLSTAVVAPIARAMVTTAMAVNPGCFTSCRRAYRMSLITNVAVDSSLFAQSPDWVDASRAPGGQKTCSQRSDRDHRECCSKRQWIVWTYLKKQIAHQPCEHECGDCPD